ncbi:sugar O-acetyltransferase [Clostridium sp. CM028]|uniref:sugar O-acetyltransferase n=1 Tax=Clostridium sp. CM028 TaxID=2851575 RepID=UPI001C6F4D7B|nr:sugar O-acetyltransferase [Clostridium sp. CM028]MBW9149078.1 sugar O-acetyltransferase [Clostridium sp. CM028]WLC62656.1 sugar O-acetyltransferase [Clostridium sp. CM028]
MTEKEKMLSGKPYKAFEEELLSERQYAKEMIFDYNTLRPSQGEKQMEIVKKLLGVVGSGFHIESPFRCDYGYNISIGENFYSNYNCTILDCAKVTIGDNVMFAPNVSLFTAGHPIHFEPRNAALEYAFPINIGDNVWIGGGVIVNPGITIGDNVVIGSGSVVTKDIASNSIAVGNPCKIIREVTEEDKKYYFKNFKL